MRRQWSGQVVAAVLLAVAVGSAGAVSVASLDPGRPELSVQASGNADVVADSYRLSYVGTAVDSVTVAVNNTQSGRLTGSVTVTARALNGSTVASGSKSSILFSVTGVTSVTVDFSGDPAADRVAWVEVRITAS